MSVGPVVALSRAVRPPRPVEVGELLAGLGSEIFWLEPSGDGDGHPHLLEIGGAVGARPQVALESLPISPRKLSPPGSRSPARRPADTTRSLRRRSPFIRSPSSPISPSRAVRKLLRPRWSRTRWLPSVMSSTVQTSSAGRPSTSRSSTTSRWRSGRLSMASRSTGPHAAATRRSSTSDSQGMRGSAHAPAPSNRPGLTAGSVGSRGMWRCSRTPEVRARLTRMRNNHVLNEDRPSNRSMPRTTPIHVSWTTSSATASLGTNVRARRSSAPWYRPTRTTNDCSSPSRS